LPEIPSVLLEVTNPLKPVELRAARIRTFEQLLKYSCSDVTAGADSDLDAADGAG
jgi:hypothetical protein